VVIVRDKTVPIAQELECAERGWVQMTATLKPEDYAPSLLVGRVSNPADRELVVLHGGHELRLAAHSSSDALNNATLVGPWTVRLRLKEGESCGGASPNMPPPIRVDVLAHCSPN
jgi:hypothetical protein